MKTEAQSYWGGIIKSMGLVFGDIGTSPIYTLTVIMTLTKPDAEHVLGILSLIVWTLIILVTVEYAWLAMSLGRKGEGGTIVLKEILIRLLKSGRQAAFAGFLAFLGVSLLLGDGVITPAISILSAVEGMRLIPGLEDLAQGGLILVAAVIAVFLFIFQFKGTDKVAAAFGPIMVVWFSALTVSGLASIIGTPTVVQAISPHHAVLFLKHNGLAGFFVLSEVILCATGGEALYADMGHLGRKPIIRAWYFVFCLHGEEPGADALHPVPAPHHLGHDHRLPGPDQRGVLHRLPGDHHPHPAADESGLHLHPPEVPDLHRLGQLVAPGGGHLHHDPVPAV